MSPGYVPVFWDTTLQRVLSTVGGVTLRMEAGGRNPSLGDIDRPGDLANLFQSRGDTNSLVMQAWFLCRRFHLHPETGGSCRGQEATQVHHGVTFPATCSQLLCIEPLQSSVPSSLSPPSPCSRDVTPSGSPWSEGKCQPF